jgi:hypothetical protein
MTEKYSQFNWRILVNLVKLTNWKSALNRVNLKLIFFLPGSSEPIKLSLITIIKSIIASRNYLSRLIGIFYFHLP